MSVVIFVLCALAAFFLAERKKELYAREDHHYSAEVRAAIGKTALASFVVWIGLVAFGVMTLISIVKPLFI